MDDAALQARIDKLGRSIARMRMTIIVLSIVMTLWYATTVVLGIIDPSTSPHSVSTVGDAIVCLGWALTWWSSYRNDPLGAGRRIVMYALVSTGLAIKGIGQYLGGAPVITYAVSAFGMTAFALLATIGYRQYRARNRDAVENFSRHLSAFPTRVRWEGRDLIRVIDELTASAVRLESALGPSRALAILNDAVAEHDESVVSFYTVDEALGVKVSFEAYLTQADSTGLQQSMYRDKKAVARINDAVRDAIPSPQA